MPTVRPLSRDDLPQVVDLFARIFRPGSTIDVENTRNYFEHVYFENPWFDPEIRSLVYDDDSGNILGFLGAVPRPMRARKKALRAAVIGNLMVETGAAGAYASTRLMKECLDGPQDLSLTDSAAEDSRKIFELCGGSTAVSSSLDWIRAIRPCSYRAQKYLGRRPLFRTLLTPVCGLADFALEKTGRGHFRKVAHDCDVESLEAAELCTQLDDLSGYAILPTYEAETLDWILREAATKRGHGELRKCLVRARESGAVLGWYVYFRNPGGTSRVLQLGAAHSSSMERVFTCLVDEESRAGANVVTGRLDPRWQHSLGRHHCHFVHCSWVLVHSREQAYMTQFRQGEAFFTGLEGEEWMRFVGDPFSE